MLRSLEVIVVGKLAEPDYEPCRCTLNECHVRNQKTTLVDILLIDAYRINPQWRISKAIISEGYPPRQILMDAS